MKTPIQFVVKIITNPRTPELLVSITFVLTFAIQPYNPISSILAVFTGLSVLYIWSNWLAMHKARTQFEACKDNVEVIYGRIPENAIENIALRTSRYTRNDVPQDPNLFESYTQIGIIFNKNSIRRTTDIQPILNSLDTRNIIYHRLHTVTALIGLVFMAAGSAMEITGNVLKKDPTTNSTCLIDTTSPPAADSVGLYIKIGSGIFSFGFAGCALLYFILAKLISDQLTILELLLRAGRDEESQIQPSLARGALELASGEDRIRTPSPLTFATLPGIRSSDDLIPQPQQPASVASRAGGMERISQTESPNDIEMNFDKHARDSKEEEKAPHP